MTNQPTYISIHTTYGLQRMAAAEAARLPINLTEMAVGDGNGNDVIPDQEQKQLVGQRYRAKINRVFQDASDPNKYTAELIVPAKESGFTIRELGIFDADGGLFIIGNTPPTYKPTLDEGAYADSVFRVDFLVTNAGVVNLVVDPNVTVVTRTWLTNNISIGALLPGGLARQIASKRTNADGDIEWIDPTGVTVTVDTIEEPQTLAENQTTVNLVATTTRSLAVYIGGLRKAMGAGADEWKVADAGASMTRITLGKSYAAGTRILLVQNDPAGNAAAPLERNRNLSDLENVEAARINLGVYSMAETDQKAPVSAICHFACAKAPLGWLKANGAAVSRTVYAPLFAAIGTTFGQGDGFNTFNLPDLRGEFVRGWDDDRGADLARPFGSTQASQNQAHTHAATAANAGSHSHTYMDTDTIFLGTGGFAAGPNYNINDRETNYQTGSAGLHTHAITIAATGGTEARPRNVALLACIKY